jgi:CTP synthase (UTP-ammonia lyase)
MIPAVDPTAQVALKIALLTLEASDLTQEIKSKIIERAIKDLDDYDALIVTDKNHVASALARAKIAAFVPVQIDDLIAEKK